MVVSVGFTKIDVLSRDGVSAPAGNPAVAAGVAVHEYRYPGSCAEPLIWKLSILTSELGPVAITLLQPYRLQGLLQEFRKVR